MDIVGMLAPAWTGVQSPMESLSDFSGNAVIAMMIPGCGVAGTGSLEKCRADFVEEFF